ncbi:Transmembrane domain-containing protein [Brazilian cedratvirus IHUMI]|uniref:Transmembrane domain-containing protein n=1 Tax=Brazilian cedratvirus IHUMI TaxID=2126980 RepID=A0A2R8FEM3_9VIRU|nr:Transmembrane domain-containing protein [Brazilian cedratvirus IHUMI]
MYIFIFIVLIQQALCLLLLNNRGYQGLEMLYGIIQNTFYVCSVVLLTYIISHLGWPLFP